MHFLSIRSIDFIWHIKSPLVIISGNHAHKLLTSSVILHEILQLFPVDNEYFKEAEFHVNLLLSLGRVQSSAKATFLGYANISELESRIDDFRRLLLHVKFFVT